ncbi:unnamed protein product [Adineta steineri]|uniref:RING-type domain-containing protein n=1 Tax=Adineta steineri TaxID=433720 RepID=A0A813VPX4_9BILA|nr:unnamed protein product [Adineta steineri]CAF0872921.1 unnamed protein product [Adineta steineri]CAF0881115.1 unnamed protein product [Adineta steineri]CAF3679277.1 unnamed protein product [Adineta steineri]CAF3840858.1 unnamed protein product [Adineta steineri]
MSLNVLDTYRDCPFCLKLLYEPVSTLCGHTFCLLCLERFIIASDSILKCPICREDLTYLRSTSNHLKTNTILHNLFRQEYEKEYEMRRNELESIRKNIIKKRLIIGNTHQLLSCDYNHKQHEWTLFIRFDNDDQNDIGQYIKQIQINLHPTFTPSQIILDKPPFRLTRIGWGVFTVHISIEFHAKWNKSDLVTNWFLSFTNTGNHKVMEIGFQKSTDDITIN